MPVPLEISEPKPPSQGRLMLVLLPLLIIIAIGAWSLEDSRRAQTTDKARHNAVMDLVHRIEANQTSIDVNQASIAKNQASIETNQKSLQAGLDANARWRDEMRPLIVRMTTVLERVEPRLGSSPRP